MGPLSTPPAAEGRARIAIAPRRFQGDPHEPGAWRARQLFFERTLTEHVAAADALPVGLHLPPAAQAAVFAERYADLCDGLLLQGGTDIDAVFSQAAPAGVVDGDRDTFELALFAAFARRNKAVLGICRGMQLINVAAGGTLRTMGDALAVAHSDPSRYATHAHAIALQPKGYLESLYRVARGTVSSAHRQAVASLGDELISEARVEEDGCIEAVRSTRHRYVVGVQWHPEYDEGDAGRLEGARLIADFIAYAHDAGRDINAALEASHA
jgi:putative glutamine amidotransferase